MKKAIYGLNGKIGSGLPMLLAVPAFLVALRKLIQGESDLSSTSFQAGDHT